MSDVTEREVVITRVFDAPRERVFAVWTDPAHLSRWWGPRHFTSPKAVFDARPGGRVLLGMRSPDGQESWNAGEVREVRPPSRLVIAMHFSNERGERVAPSAYGLPGDWPTEQIITVTFDDVDGKTRMTMRQTGIPSHWNEMTTLGWGSSLDKLAELLEVLS